MAKKRKTKRSKKTSAKKNSASKKELKGSTIHAPALSEVELISPLSEELRDAWSKFKSVAEELGEQTIYTSAKAIMFSNRICHFFIRPKRNHLELTLLVNNEIDHPLIAKTQRPTKQKFAHIVKITHADHIEEPLTDWMREAYSLSK